MCSDRQLKIFVYREIPTLRHICMEINLRIIQSLLTWHLWSIKHLSQLFPTCMKHKWGGYLHFTAITPFKTVCKQFINGSVPFDYSLNSGFDTGMTAGLVEMSGRWAHLLRKCLQKQELGCREHSNFITSRGHRRKRWSGSNTSSIRKPSSSSEWKGKKSHLGSFGGPQ